MSFDLSSSAGKRFEKIPLAASTTLDTTFDVDADMTAGRAGLKWWSKRLRKKGCWGALVLGVPLFLLTSVFVLIAQTLLRHHLMPVVSS